jgi:hypothetical protein
MNPASFALAMSVMHVKKDSTGGRRGNVMELGQVGDPERSRHA